MIHRIRTYSESSTQFSKQRVNISSQSLLIHCVILGFKHPPPIPWHHQSLIILFTVGCEHINNGFKRLSNSTSLQMYNACRSNGMGILAEWIHKHVNSGDNSREMYVIIQWRYFVYKIHVQFSPSIQRSSRFKEFGSEISLDVPLFIELIAPCFYFDFLLNHWYRWCIKIWPVPGVSVIKHEWRGHIQPSVV